MLSKLIAGGIIVFGCAGLSLAGDRYDRGDRYRGGHHYDRGDRYRHHDSGHRSSGRWSVGFGYSSGGYYGDRSYVSIGYSNRNFGSYYSYRSGPVCAPPVYVAPRPVYVERPVYVAPPVVYQPAPVIVERPVYVAPPVVYTPAPSYYYNSCGSSYSGVRYYYGR